MNNTSYICPCCMENHDKKIIKIKESNIFKGVSVDYEAEYTFCSVADETYADEQQLSSNDIAMKNAYRLKTGLLTSDQIADIRSKYDISQADLCLLLGWGLQTITRYESHQVQDIAHDTILRKLDNDPEWFLELLKTSKDSISVSAYAKYLEAGTLYFEKDHDNYLKSAIMSKYARFQNRSDVNGNKELSIDVVIDMIQLQLLWKTERENSAAQAEAPGSYCGDGCAVSEPDGCKTSQRWDRNRAEILYAGFQRA